MYSYADILFCSVCNLHLSDDVQHYNCLCGRLVKQVNAWYNVWVRAADNEREIGWSLVMRMAVRHRPGRVSLRLRKWWAYQLSDPRTPISLECGVHWLLHSCLCARFPRPKWRVAPSGVKYSLSVGTIAVGNTLLSVAVRRCISPTLHYLQLRVRLLIGTTLCGSCGWWLLYYLDGNHFWVDMRVD